MAFYPSVMALAGFLFALLMIKFGNGFLSGRIASIVPPFAIDSEEAVIPILTVLISGLISMMVFSFSMVMILLNQAASNYSPRLLPGLISDKKHQIILGIYLFTILYSVFILFSFEPEESIKHIAGFILAIIFTIIGLCAFIYFIHNISQSIQIDTILNKIFNTSRATLEDLVEKQPEEMPHFPSTDDWFEYYPKTSGYLQNIAFSNLASICEKENMKIHILAVQGIFVLKHAPIFRASKRLDEKCVARILSNLDFSKGELVADNYVLAFKQITEVIAKAMSPGINDPGTAVNGLDYLTELFALRMQKNDHIIISHNEEPLVKINSLQFDELLYNVMASIRVCSKNNILVVQKLLVMFRYFLDQAAVNDQYREAIEIEVETLMADVKEGISNKRDVAQAFLLAEKLKLINSKN